MEVVLGGGGREVGGKVVGGALVDGERAFDLEGLDLIGEGDEFGEMDLAEGVAGGILGAGAAFPAADAFGPTLGTVALRRFPLAHDALRADEGYGLNASWGADHLLILADKTPASGVGFVAHHTGLGAGAGLRVLSGTVVVP